MLKKLLLATTAMFMLSVAPAHAGPLVGGIGALIGGIAGTGLSIGGLALGIFSMGAQWLLSMLLAPEVEQKGVKTKMDTGGDNPPSFILGEYCTAGQLVYANVWDKSGYNIENACLVYVVQLSCKPVTGLSTVVFANNEKVTLNPGTNWNGFMQVDEYVKGASGGGYFLVKFHDGTQNDSDSWLMDKFGSDPDRPWKNDMIGEGCAYVIVQAWYSNRGIWTGLPDLRWVVQGSSLYDPRKDSTVPGGSGLQRWNNPNTWTFTKNPKVIEYNTIRGIRQSGEHLWGGTAEAYRLPLEYWFAAMNACDENISKTGGGSVKRFEIGCEIHLDDKPIEIINEINKSCNGFTTEFGGTYKTWVGGPGLPVGTITDDDFLITAEMETNKFQSQQSTYNTAYGTYPEPKQQWEPKDGPRYVMDDAVEEDGEELALDISLPFVSENNQVQRILRAAVRDSRRQVTHEGQLPPKAWVYEPFDCLAYQSTMFGYSGDGKDFLIASKDDLPNVNQRVLLREVDISDTGWLPEYEQAFDTAPLVIVTPGTMQADFNVFPDQVDTTTGKDKPAIRAEWAWAGPEIDVRKVDWQIRYPSTTKVIAEGSINDARGGVAIIESDVLRFGKTYEIQLRAVPYAVRDSDWTAWKTVTCVVVAVPTAPSLTRVSKLGTDGKLSYFVDVTWTLVAQEATYAVKMIVDGQTVIHPATTSPLRIPVAAGAVLTVSVAAIGSDGTVGSYSSTAAITITKKNTAPTAPTSLTATGKIGRIDYVTNKNPDGDFDHFNLYASNTNDFTTAVLVDDSRSIRLQQGDLGNAVTRYAWITAVDNSGNESSKFPVSNTAGRVATTTRVAAADIDDGAVTDAKTDQTAPGTPAAPTLANFTGDIDIDGTIDTGLTLAVTAPAGVKVIGYEVERYRAATVGGTYTARGERLSFPAEDPNTAGTVTSYTFKANQAFFWKVRARAIAFNGKKGTWSAQTTTGVSPLGYSATLPASAPSVAQVANGYRYAWAKPADKAYKETEVLVNGTPLTRVAGTAYTDTTTRTVGDTPTITVRHYDRADNVGSVSSGTVAPAYRAASAGEVGVLAAGNMGVGIVGTPVLVDSSVTPRKANLGNLNNQVKDNLLIDPTLWTASGGTGTTISPQPNNAGAIGQSTNFFRVTSALAIGQQITFASLPINPCTPETLLSFSCRIRRYLPASTWGISLSVDWYTLDSGGNAVFLSSSAGSSVVSLVSGSTVYLAKFSEFVPAGAVFFALKLVTAAAASATTYGFDFGGPTAIQAQSCIVEKTYTLTTITIPPSTTSTIVTHVCNHTTAATQVKLSFQMLHLSSSGRNLTIVFKKNGSTLWTMPTVHVDVDEQWNYFYLDEAVSGSSSTYTIEVTAAAASVDIGQRMMVTDSPLQ